MKIDRRYNWPHCAVCDKLVEQVSKTTDMINLNVHITAHCHGEQETVVVPRELYYSALGVEISIGGKAFEKKGLGENHGTRDTRAVGRLSVKS